MGSDDAQRTSSLRRQTNETRIELGLKLDGTGRADIQTRVPFFDHMLELFARHSLIDLEVRAEGDLEVDYHHTVEDVGLVLGRGLREALGESRGINRYGHALLPMDEVLVRVAVDAGGRPYLGYQVRTPALYVRDFNILLVREFLQALVNQAGINLHVILEAGEEPHHIAEAIFKGFARAFRMAVESDPRRSGELPSTKGLL